MDPTLKQRADINPSLVALVTATRKETVFATSEAIPWILMWSKNKPRGLPKSFKTSQTLLACDGLERSLSAWEVSKT